MHIVMLPDDVIELNRELASGYHPVLESILTNIPESSDLADRLGHIAAHCNIEIDAVFTSEGLVSLMKLLTSHLKRNRQIPHGQILTLQ